MHRWSVPQDWPNYGKSRKIRGPVHDWHIQQAGHGQKILVLHGAGGSTHSFRDSFLNLVATCNVMMVDLPGHGFTQLGAQHRSGLRPMAEDISALCEQEGFNPDCIIGHSAGGAIALEMARTLPGTKVVGINAALGSFQGLAGVVFPALAKMLAAVPFTSRVFAGLSATPARIKSLIRETGSDIDPEGLDLYRRLVAREEHVQGALSMMAQWSLDDLLAALARIQNPCLLIASSGDKTVPAAISERAAKVLPNGRYLQLDGLGHLAHEEDPKHLSDLCWQFIQQKTADQIST